MQRNAARLSRFTRGSALVLSGALAGALVTGFGPSIGIAVAKSVPQAPACTRNVFAAEAKRAVDGDTIEVLLDQGLGNFRKTHIRLVGIDTPEVHGPLEARDLVRGPAATAFTEDWLERRGNLVEIHVHGDDKYGGRMDGIVYPRGGGQSLSDALREAGHAK